MTSWPATMPVAGQPQHVAAGGGEGHDADRHERPPQGGRGEEAVSTTASQDRGREAPIRRSSGGSASTSSSHGHARNAANSISSGSHCPSRRRLPSWNRTDSTTRSGGDLVDEVGVLRQGRSGRASRAASTESSIGAWVSHSSLRIGSE